jgi:hypothetical protein
MNKGPRVTYERVRELLNYKDGRFFWKEEGPSRRKGMEAGGSMSGVGYKMIRLDYTLYAVHQIVFLWHNGYFPEHVIDHINRDKLDNRIENLREVSRSCNSKNSVSKHKIKSGVQGVYWDNFTGSWKPSIRANGKQLNLPRCKNLDDAVMSRWSAEVKYGYFECKGESPAYSYLSARGLV